MNGAKPTLAELGPYVFYENHHKTKLVWNENNTVTYQQIRFVPYMFDISHEILWPKLSLYLLTVCARNTCVIVMRRRRHSI